MSDANAYSTALPPSEPMRAPQPRNPDGSFLTDRNVPDDPDASNGYMAHREAGTVSAEASELDQWLSTRPNARADIQPFPIGKHGEPQSTAGKVMRNVAEIPSGIVGGMESAINHAMGWAINPLADWLNENVADLTYTREIDTPTGKIAKSLSEFFTGFIPALKGLRAVGMTGAVAAPILAGAIADFAVRDPHEARLSNLWQQLGLPKNILTDYLAASPDDTEIEGRFKSATESVLTGLAAEGVIRGARALRGARNVAKQASSERELLRQKYGEIADDEAVRALGDPKRPAIENVRVATKPQIPAASVAKATDKIESAIQAAEKSAPASPVKSISIVDIRNAEGKQIGTVRQLLEPEWIKRFEEVGDVEVFTNPKLNSFAAMITRPLTEAQKAAGVPAVARIEVNPEWIGALAGAEKTSVETQFRGALFHEIVHARRVAIGRDITSPAGRAAAEASAEKAQAFATKLAKGEQVTAAAVPEDIVGGRGVVSIGEMKSYVNFARINGPDDMKATLAEMADKFKTTISEASRGTISHAETKKLADALDMDVPTLLARRRGQPLNAEEALAARELWAASGESLLESARAAAKPGAGQLEQFAFRRSMALHAAIQSEVMGARTETARALSAWRIPAGGSIEKARAIGQMLEGAGGEAGSKEFARRLAILADNNPAAVARFVEKGWGAKSFDAVREVWVNGLLSSPATHAVNTLSNTAAAFQQMVERGVAARIGELRGTEGGVAPGEALSMAYGMTQSINDAFSLAWKSLKSGETGASLNKIDLPRGKAIAAETFGMSSTGAVGRTVDLLGNTFRIPGRFLGAEDEFFKTIGYRMELHAQSLRQATSEGLKGDALALRMREILLNPPENIRIAAVDQALYQTFNNAPGDIGKAIMKLRGDVPAISFVLPFVRTPVNIARYTFERTPFAPLVGQWRADIAAGGARADLALARMATGSAVMLAALDWADSGRISGSGKELESGEREAMTRQGWQPYSIHVGNRWYSYNRTDPFGAMLGFSGDAAAAIRRGEMNEDDIDEWQEVTAMAGAAVAQVAINKTYLRGLSEVFSVMGDPSRNSERYISNLVTSFIPYTALAGATERAIDPTVRETANPWDAVNAKLAGLSAKLPPKRNLWGEEIRSESGLGKAYDFASPAQAREIKPSPIDTEIMRLAPIAGADNVQGAAPTRIAKRTSFQGVQVNFKEYPEAYDEYVRLSGYALVHPAFGKGAKEFLNDVVTGDSPISKAYKIRSDEMKLVFINQVIHQYRLLAQQEIMNDPKYAEFAAHVHATQAIVAASRLPVLPQAEPAR